MYAGAWLAACHFGASFNIQTRACRRGSVTRQGRDERGGTADDKRARLGGQKPRSWAGQVQGISLHSWWDRIRLSALPVGGLWRDLEQSHGNASHVSRSSPPVCLLAHLHFSSSPHNDRNGGHR